MRFTSITSNTRPTKTRWPPRSAPSIQRDTFYAKARNFKSALEGAMFPDPVPVSVYDNLIESVHRKLPSLHHYYDVRRRKMGLKDIHHYDTYVPILSKQDSRHTWDEAVKIILEALAPLGNEYCERDRAGLSGRWCDRYENRGKQSGAFSQRLLRRQALHPHQLPARRARFRLHDGPRGRPLDAQLFLVQDPALRLLRLHATSSPKWPAPSTKRCLSRYLLKNARDNQERAFLLNHEIDSIRGDDLPPNHVRRVRQARPRLGRVGRAADGRSHQEASTTGC